MICLCCGKEIVNEDNYWHKKCIKKFFSQSVLPTLKINTDDENIKKNIKVFVPGVQKKLSVHIDKDSDKRISYYDEDSRYIIKLENDYKEITVAEQVTMLMANDFGIRTCEHGLIKVDNSYIYIVKRFDRKETNKIHVEDFCQLSNKLTNSKYKGSYEQAGKIIDRYSEYKKLDKIELYKVVIFSFVTLNNDMHLKNFSLIEDKSIRLSPAYDLLPTNLFVDDGTDFALQLNGKDRNITKKDLIKLGMTLEIDDKIINKIISDLTSKEESFINIINNSLLSDSFKEKYIVELTKRINILK